jgi:hypothetical protein
LTFVQDRQLRPQADNSRATLFQLTRVTRIFQKSVFSKAAPSSPGETRRAFLLLGPGVQHPERECNRQVQQKSGCCFGLFLTMNFATAACAGLPFTGGTRGLFSARAKR